MKRTTLSLLLATTLVTVSPTAAMEKDTKSDPAKPALVIHKERKELHSRQQITRPIITLPSTTALARSESQRDGAPRLSPFRAQQPDPKPTEPKKLTLRERKELAMQQAGYEPIRPSTAHSFESVAPSLRLEPPRGAQPQLGSDFEIVDTRSSSLDVTYPSTWRYSESYLQKTEGEIRVLVIGAGKKALNYTDSTDYPENYYLVDINPPREPDLLTDITAKNALPKGFTGLIDVVIWERVDSDLLLKPETLPNIFSALKEGGLFITNMPCIILSTTVLTDRHKESHVITIEDGVQYDSDPSNSHSKFQCFVSDEICKDVKKTKIVERKFFDLILKSNFEPFFEDIEIIEWTPFWKESPVDDGYISMKKKKLPGES